MTETDSGADPNVKPLSDSNCEAEKNPFQDDLMQLNRIFIRTLRMLGDAGECDSACRFAAEGWSLLRHRNPRAAEQLNGVLHYLTNTNHIHNRRRA